MLQSNPNLAIIQDRVRIYIL